MLRQANEILILRRFPGYSRFHIPALIYSAKASYLLEKGLSAIDGVRKVTIKKNIGKISVYYDTVLTPEGEIFLAMDRIATPLLKGDQQESYEKIMTDVEVARKRRLVRKIAVSAILIYLAKVHYHLMVRQWLKDPIRHAPKLASIAILIYIHRKHIKAAPNFED